LPVQVRWDCVIRYNCRRGEQGDEAFCTIATLGLTLIGAVGSALAQYYGGPDSYGRDYGYEERGGPRYRERDSYEERGPRSRGRENAFDERTYLRCNPTFAELS
jgi:hypothetical protein